MDLTEFSKSEEFNLLPRYEREYFNNHGTFKDKSNVKKILSKHFKNVKFSGRGKAVKITIGKPKITGTDELDTALVKSIIAQYEPGKRLSFSRWLAELGINGQGAFNLDKQIDKVKGVRKSLLITYGNKLHAKQRDYFTKAFNKAAKKMGGEVEKVSMGSYFIGDGNTRPELLRPSDKVKIDEVLEQLRGKGIKSPIYARKQDEYEQVLDELGLDMVWTAYTITGVDEFHLAELRAGNTFPGRYEVRTLFKREFRKWLKANIIKAEEAIKGKPLNDKLAEAVELGVITESQAMHSDADANASWYLHCLVEGTAWTEYKRLEPYLLGDKPYSAIRPPLTYDEWNYTVEAKVDEDDLPL